MPSIDVNGITLEYETSGDEKNPVLLLIMGLGNQLTAWPELFCRMLEESGFFVIRFDNRDIGLSTKIKVEKEPNMILLALMTRLGIKTKVPYTLSDMAKDTIALCDALGLDNVHLAGISMGGMIAQIVAADYPERIKSLTCIISSSGNQRMPGPRAVVLKKVMQKPRGRDLDSWIEYYFELFKLIGSPSMNEQDLLERVKDNIARSLYPRGTLHQLAAIINDGSRTALLKRISAPTLVINGSVDPLIPYAAGKDIVNYVPNSRFKLIEGLGHDLPDPLIPQIVDLINNHLSSV
jgi:pimeloyl-ACP methyl ester carboxylesterase